MPSLPTKEDDTCPLVSFVRFWLRRPINHYSELNAILPRLGDATLILLGLEDAVQSAMPVSR